MTNLVPHKMCHQHCHQIDHKITKFVTNFVTKYPGVFCDEFVAQFITKYGDEFSESPNLVKILVTKLVTNLVMKCSCDEFFTKFITKFGDEFSESPNLSPTLSPNLSPNTLGLLYGGDSKVSEGTKVNQRYSKVTKGTPRWQDEFQGDKSYSRRPSLLPPFLQLSGRASWECSISVGKFPSKRMRGRVPEYVALCQSVGQCVVQ